MSTNPDQAIKRIKHIRRSKRLRMKDCAKALGVSKETYRCIEEGTRSLTLPELETLSFYLGVSPSALLENKQNLDEFPNILKEDIRPHYLTLRDKMIAAFLTSVRANKALTVEDIQEATQIPEDLLQTYENGETPIPLSDLLKISDFLAIPRDALFEPIWLAESIQEKPSSKEFWQQRFSKEDPGLEEDGYSILVDAIKQMSEVDQAHIAKLILEKLQA